MNPVCSEVHSEVRSEDFSPHDPERTTEVVTTNVQACSEDFSHHHRKATTEVVTTSFEVGGTCHV